MEHYFLVLGVFDSFSTRKPHQILLLASDYPAHEDLLRVEVLVMASYMKWKMRMTRSEQSVVRPVSPILPSFPFFRS
jgi:hypothetical protein